jgi:hypothetical protein
MADKLEAEVEALAREFAARVTRLVARSLAEDVSAALSRHVSPAGAGEGDAPAREPPQAVPQAGGAPPRRRRELGPRPRGQGLERWVPDRRARRVPKFVIEATGLDTKKDIVERYGEHAIFEKGQPAPPPLRGPRGETAG